MTHIFLSYSRKDSIFVDHLRDLLENEGFGVWMDRTQLMPAKDWEKEIERAIRACGAFAVVMSPDSQGSVPVEREIRLAEKYKKPIFPVLLAGYVWPRLAHLQVDDMCAGMNAPLSPRLAQALRLELGQPEAVRSSRLRRLMIGGALLVLVPLALILLALIVQMGRDGVGGDDNGKGTQPLDSNMLLKTVIVQQSTETAAAYTKTPTSDTTQTLAVLAAEAFAQTATAEAEAALPTWTAGPPPSPTLTHTPRATIPGIFDPLIPTETPTATVQPAAAAPIPAGSAVEFGIRDEMRLNRVPFVYVPAGCFMMGSEDGESNERPVHEVCLDAYWIGQTEVTNAQYKQCVEASGCTVPGDTRYYDDAQYVDHPVVYVDWTQARAYAAWLAESTGVEVQLPTEAQWEYAARGPGAWTYSWGNNDPTCELANGYVAGFCVGGTSPAGSYPTGASWVGALDMIGNVWEWTSSIYDEDHFPYPYRADDGRENSYDHDARRVLRGGSWRDLQVFGRAAYRSYVYFQSDWHSNFGFRVVGARSPSQ